MNLSSIIVYQKKFMQRGGYLGRREGGKLFCSKTMCTHSKWANEQTLKTKFCLSLLFFILLTRTNIIHPFTKIPVLNDYPPLFSNCIRDVIQVEQKYLACIFFDTKVYYYLSTIFVTKAQKLSYKTPCKILLYYSKGFTNTIFC